MGIHKLYIFWTKLNEFGQNDGVKKMEFLGFIANLVVAT
jgi:hypothetical protein